MSPALVDDAIGSELPIPVIFALPFIAYISWTSITFAQLQGIRTNVLIATDPGSTDIEHLTGARGLLSEILLKRRKDLAFLAGFTGTISVVGQSI